MVHARSGRRNKKPRGGEPRGRRQHPHSPDGPCAFAACPDESRPLAGRRMALPAEAGRRDGQQEYARVRRGAQARAASRKLHQRPGARAPVAGVALERVDLCRCGGALHVAAARSCPVAVGYRANDQYSSLGEPRSAGALHPPPTGRPTPTPTAPPPPTRRRSPARGRSLSPAPRGSPAPRPSQCGSPLATSSCRSSASIRRAVLLVTIAGQALPRSVRCAPRAGQPEDRAQSPEDVRRLDALREQRKLRLARVDGLPAHGDDAGRVWLTAQSPHSVSTPVPGSVTSMLPVHAHWHFESSVSAGTALRVTMLDPGDHGAGITGIQG